MTHPATLSTLTALSMACAMLTACGGGAPEAPPPPIATPPAGTPVAGPDTVAPTVTIANDTPAPTAAGAVTFTFVFSEDVGVSFTADDVTITGGTAGAFTRTSGSQATLVVVPSANTKGVMSVSVAAGKFADLAGNTNSLAATAQKAYDTTAPVGGGGVATFPINFDDASVTYTLTGFGGAEDATIVSGVAGATGKVVKVVKSGTAELWAGTTVSTAANNSIPTVAFSASAKTMTMRVFTPAAGIPVRLKLEDAADVTHTVETEAVTTVAGGWETLTFNFAAPAAGTAALNLAYTYNKASVFFNFGKTGAAGGAGTYYFDDLNFVAGSSGGSSGLPVTFDTAGTTYTLTGFGGAEDSTVVSGIAGATGKVAKVVKSATAELWAGTTVSTGANNSISTVPFTTSAKTMTLRVFTPAAGIPVRLKLEDAADGTHTVETEATTTVAGGWETLTFNFAAPASGTAALNLAYTYNKASVFFNFGKTGAAGGAGTYYFDDLAFVAGSTGGGGTGSGSSLPVTFDATGVTYTLTGFGGAEDATVVSGVAGASGKAARVVKSGTAELWAGTTVSTGPNNSIPTVPFTASAKTMTLRVLTPAAGIPVRLKLEDAADPTHTVETEATTTVAGGWETLTFNFAAQASGTAALNLAFTYNKASVFFNFGKTGAAGGGGTYYFDELAFVAGSGGSGSGSGGALIYASDYSTAGIAAKTAQGGDAGAYIDSAATITYSWGGVASLMDVPPPATPSFYFGWGLQNSGTLPGYLGGYVKAPANGTANITGYTNLNISVWGNDELVNRKPTFTVILKGPTVSSCASELKSTLAVTAAGVQTYNLPLSAFTLQTACGYANAAAALAAGVNEVHVQVLPPNIQFIQKDSGGGAYPNGLNLGPIKFN